MTVTYRALLVIAENGGKATVDSGSHATADAAVARLTQLVTLLSPQPVPMPSESHSLVPVHRPHASPSSQNGTGH